MATIPVVVKWSGKKFEIDLDTTEPGSTFKLQIFSLTGVPPDRQKVLIKGGQLKDDQDMAKLPLKPGHNFMLLGMAEPGFKAPEKKTVFLEDMSSAEIAKSLIQPPGLQNLGNTCYMNATLQMLRSIPEVQDNLNTYTPASSGLSAFTTHDISATGRTLTSGLRDLFKNMSDTPDSFNPAIFLQLLRTAFPQFNQRSRENNSMLQQDAEECWSQILSVLRTNLKPNPADQSFIDKFMSGTFSTRLTCDESDAEPTTEATESFLKLNCHIDITTNFMADGIKAALTEHLEKRSEGLGRDAKWTKKFEITRTPKYLVVHFVRFYWKRDTNKKAKILRKVKFPLEFDITQFCTESLKEKTLPIRDAVRDAQKKHEEAERARKRARVQAEVDSRDGTSKEEGEKMEVDEEVDVETLIDGELRGDEGCNPSGLYELSAVLTHAGSNADSGHWQAWTKQAQGDEWWRFDDSRVTSVPESKILALDGGGEADTACLLLYRAKEFPKKSAS